MENGKAEAETHPVQPEVDEILVAEAEPVGKKNVSDELLQENVIKSFPVELGGEDPGKIEENQNGDVPVKDEEQGTSFENGINGNGEKEEQEQEVDAEGYRVEERRETETMSHTEEVRETKERTELRTREIKEVTLEEVKTKESTRPISLEEFKAILDAEFDRKDEVEIGRDIIIEEFTRVESERQEASGGVVVMETFSVKEELKTEEIKEEVQFGERVETVRNETDVENGGENGQVENVTNGDEATTVVPEAVVPEVVVPDVVVPDVVVPEVVVPEVVVPDVVVSDAAVPDVVVPDVVVPDVVVPDVAVHDVAVHDVAVPEVESVVKQEEVSIVNGTEIEKSDKSEELAGKSETGQTSEEVGQKPEDPNDHKEPASDSKREKDKGAKSKGIINYIRVKARSLSRDRSNKRSAAVAAAGKSESSDEALKEAQESSKKEAEPEAHAEEKPATSKKVKTKKWTLFGKKPANHEESSSDESDSTEGVTDGVTDEVKEGTSGDKTERKKFKLNLFAKKSEEQKDEKPVKRDDTKSSPEEEKKEEEKKPWMKLVLKKKEKQKEEAEAEVVGEAHEETAKMKAPESEGDVEGIDENKEKDGEDVKEAQKSKEAEEKEEPKSESVAAVKTKEHKWFHFGKKSEKDGQSEVVIKSKGSEESKEKEHQRWNPFGKKTRKEETEVEKTEQVKNEATEEDGEAETEKKTVEPALQESRQEDESVNQIGDQSQTEQSPDSAVQPEAGLEKSDAAGTTAEEPDVKETEKQEDSTKKPPKEHKKFTFGLKFGKKSKKSPEKETEGEVKGEPQKESGSVEGAGAKTEVEAVEPVVEVTLPSEIQAETTEASTKEEVQEVAYVPQEAIGAEVSVVTSAEKEGEIEASITAVETKFEASEEKVKETVDIVDAEEHAKDASTERVFEGVSETIDETEHDEVFEGEHEPTLAPQSIPEDTEVPVEKLPEDEPIKNVVEEDVKIVAEEPVIAAGGELLEQVVEEAAEELKDLEKQSVEEQVPGVEGEEVFIVKEPIPKDDAVLVKEESQPQVQQLNLETKGSPSSEETAEEAAEAPPAVPEAGSGEATAEAKKEIKAKKFTFGLKLGQKKEGKVDEEKHKGWSPFAKKGAKKEKEVVVAEAEHQHMSPEMSGDEKATTPVTDSELSGGDKNPGDEEKLPESREGTLKKNKGLHKLFSFGRRSKSSEERSVSPDHVTPAAETDEGASAAVAGGEAAAVAAEEKVEAVEEEKPRQKKFHFGLKFGKKHEKDSGEVAHHTPDNAKQSTAPVTVAPVQKSAASDEQIELLSYRPLQTEPAKVDEKSTSEITESQEKQNQDDSKEVSLDKAEPVVDQHTEIQVVEESSVISKVGELEAVNKPVDLEEEPAVIEVKEIVIQSENVEVTEECLVKHDEDQPELAKEKSVEFDVEKEEPPVSDEQLHKTELDVAAAVSKSIVEFEDVKQLEDDVVVIAAEGKAPEVSFEGEVEQGSTIGAAEVGECRKGDDLVVVVLPVEVVGSEEKLDETTAEKIDIQTSAETAQAPESGAGAVDAAVKEEVPEVKPPTESQPDSGKDQKTKKSLFGIKFGKKSKQAPAKEAHDEHDQNGALGEEKEVAEHIEEEKFGEKVVSEEGVDKAKEPEGVEKLIIEVEVVEESNDKHDKEEKSSTNQHHHLGIKWPHFGKKGEKKKDGSPEPDPKSEEHEDKSAEPEAAHLVQDSEKKTPVQTKVSSKKSSHGLGKGLLKIFTPKKQLKFDKEDGKSNGHLESEQQEPVVVYSVVGEGQLVAETHWRPKTELAKEEVVASEPSIQLQSAPAELELEAKDTASQEVKPIPSVLVNGTAHDSDAVEPEVSYDACALEAPSPPGFSLSHFVVVAIDFGTTFSGYAFSFVNDPDSIHMMRKWEGGDPGVVNQKTPTTILLTPDGSFHSFGFTARDFYHDLDPAETDKWMYFEKFKMSLHHNTDLNKETTVVASNGKEFSAMKIFSYALRFFKDHALKELTSQSSVTIDNDDVRWVITVPAIWKAPAKQFMREAAYQAGIASAQHPDRLLIALEPEAASIYVRKLRMSQLIPDRPPSRPMTPHKEPPINTSSVSAHDDGQPISVDHVADHLKAGTRYMVVDCGGGTVDITVHELETIRGNLKELYKATGGPFGSIGVDQRFEQLLFEIFGEDFIKLFKQKRPAGWVDLMIAFESRKRAANPHKDNPLNVSLPFSFIDFYKKQYGAAVDTAIRKYDDKGVSWSIQGMLKLSPEAMYNLFRPTLDKIKETIHDVLSHSSVQGIEFLFLVGGFSESAILQQEIRKEFDDKLRIIIPQDVSLTILKGAVCFGLDPTIVTVRQSRMTYGIGVVNRFDATRHPESKRLQKDGVDWCAGIFDTFVTVGQSVTLGDKVVRRYAPANRDQTTSIIHVYCSESDSVQYVTDEGVQRCATLRLELTEAAAAADAAGSTDDAKTGRREIETTMTFGDTEIRVTARDVATERDVGSTIDFLNK